jgi:rhamnosyltransferase
VSYAEDQMLAQDLMSAGWAKTYHPAAVVTHSHDYPPAERLRRSFDEARALREVRGHRAHGGPLRPALVVQRRVRDDLALARREGAGRAALAPRSLAHHGARTLGEVLGSRADRLPAGVRRALSLEGRGGFDPQ